MDLLEIDQYHHDKVLRLEGQIKEIGIVLSDFYHETQDHPMSYWMKEMKERRELYRNQIRELRKAYDLPA